MTMNKIQSEISLWKIAISQSSRPRVLVKQKWKGEKKGGSASWYKSKFPTVGIRGLGPLFSRNNSIAPFATAFPTSDALGLDEWSSDKHERCNDVHEWTRFLHSKYVSPSLFRVQSTTQLIKPIEYESRRSRNSAHIQIYLFLDHSIAENASILLSPFIHSG